MEWIVEEIMEVLDEREEIRERLLDVSHGAIRKSSNVMALIHRGRYNGAEEKLNEIGEDIETLNELLKSYPMFYDHGAVIAAFREYAEAFLTLRIVNGKKIVHPEELNVLKVAYAQALAEVEGELRRYVLDLLRDDEVEEAEKVHERMEEIFDFLERFDYPDSILPGMKHRRDVARGTLEKTRADITRAVRQRRLEKSLKSTEIKEENSKD